MKGSEVTRRKQNSETAICTKRGLFSADRRHVNINDGLVSFYCTTDYFDSRDNLGLHPFLKAPLANAREQKMRNRDRRNFTRYR